MDLTFVAASLGASYFFYFLVSMLLSPVASIKRRLELVDEVYGAEYEVEDLRQLPFKERVLNPFKQKIKNEVSKKTPKGMFQQLELRVERAGDPYGIGVTGWMIVKGVSLIALPLFVIFLVITGEYSTIQKITYVAVSFIVAFLLPNVILDSKIKERRKLLTRQLPDALDVLTVSVESGLSFDSALAKLVEKSGNNLAKEFEKVLAEVQLGKTRRDALKNMALRCDADDVKVFISSIIQAEQLGVSIGRVLRIQAGQMRVKRRQRAEEMAMKAPVKMIIPIVFFVFPGLFVVILGPAIIQIKNTLLGM